MKTLKRFFLASLASLMVAALAHAMVVKYTANLVSETALTYSKTYPLALNSYGIDYLSFTANASSVTFTSKSFTDGQVSTGTITITSNLVLSTATAADFLTVLTTQTIPANSAVTVNGIPLYVGVHWYQDVLFATTTAISIKQAINKYVPGVLASTGPAGIVFSTATQYGSFGNSMTMTVNTSSITVSSTSFSGGRDGARITIGGKSYIAGTDFQVGVTSAATATNLATAITASSTTWGVVAAAGGQAIVFATTTATGLRTNYVMTSSTQAALTIGGSGVTTANGVGTGRMWGGTDAAYTLNGKTIELAAHGWTVALPVLYSTGSATAIGGLTRETTYYAFPVSPNAISLASTSTGAIAGVGIVFTSSQTKTVTDTFTLTPLAIAGTPSYKWQVSNDGANWFDYNTSSVTLNTFTSTGTVNTWDFAPIDYAWIQLAVTGPTAGAIRLTVTGNGKNSNN